jgi:mRNA-degrading endonuclease toxin of MazEF toxin-antitoxin module
MNPALPLSALLPGVAAEPDVERRRVVLLTAATASAGLAAVAVPFVSSVSPGVGMRRVFQNKPAPMNLEVPPHKDSNHVFPHPA